MKFPEPLKPAAMVRYAITTAVVVGAAYAGSRLWQHYELDPWTRDGRVRADIVQISPDVSGLVTAVPVRDNQDVHAGDVLFEIDRARYQLALEHAQAALATRKVARDQAARDVKRNQGLGQLVSTETLEQSRTRLEQSEADVAQAVAQLHTAQLNLARSQVKASVDGRVTNLELYVGSYATSGRPLMALIDANSFYVEGYFEETKIPRIALGDAVQIKLMGDSHQLTGHVDGISRGIADRDRSTSTNLLPNINPTFNWVRLAQRIPVRVKLDPTPDGVMLVAGRTATVSVVEK
jgi:RND family efflux transporter MFP subunit